MSAKPGQQQQSGGPEGLESWGQEVQKAQPV